MNKKGDFKTIDLDEKADYGKGNGKLERMEDEDQVQVIPGFDSMKKAHEIMRPSRVCTSRGSSNHSGPIIAVKDNAIDFQKADAEDARKYMQLHSVTNPKKEGKSYSFCCSSVEYIGSSQEPAFRFYTLFSKRALHMFLVISLFSVVLLGQNLTSTYLSSEDCIIGLEKTTLANLDGLKPMTRFATERDAGLSNMRMGRSVIMTIDILVCVFFFIHLLYMRYMASFDIDGYPKSYKTSEFAVQVKNFYKTGYTGGASNAEIDIRQHFESQFGKVVEVSILK